MLRGFGFSAKVLSAFKARNLGTRNLQVHCSPKARRQRSQSKTDGDGGTDGGDDD